MNWYKKSSYISPNGAWVSPDGAWVSPDGVVYNLKNLWGMMIYLKRFL